MFLDLGKSSYFHSVCQASKEVRGKWKNTVIWNQCETNKLLEFSVAKKEKHSLPDNGTLIEGKALVNRLCIIVCQNYQ